MKISMQANGMQLGTSDAQSLSMVILELSTNDSIKADAWELGYSKKSGYVYAYSEDSAVVVCSSFANPIEFLVTNPEDGDELFFDNYEDAENHSF